MFLSNDNLLEIFKHRSIIIIVFQIFTCKCGERQVDQLSESRAAVGMGKENVKL